MSNSQQLSTGVVASRFTRVHIATLAVVLTVKLSLLNTIIPRAKVPSQAISTWEFVNLIHRDGSIAIAISTGSGSPSPGSPSHIWLVVSGKALQSIVNLESIDPISFL